MSAYNILIGEFNNKTVNGLYYFTQITFAYNSNRIEGSSLSREQTKHIYETSSLLSQKDEVIKVDDIIETINHFKTFDFILKTAKEEIDKEYIKKIHKLLKQGITKNQVIGDFKTKQNYIGDFITTSPAKVMKEINNLLNKYNKINNVKIEDIIDFHHKFELIHPFEDGNGRVGRLIMFKECLKNDIVPFVIDEEHKLFYYRGLKEYNNQKGYLIDTCLSAQDVYAEILDTYKNNNIQIQKELDNIKSLSNEFTDILSNEKDEKIINLKRRKK